MPFTTYDNAWVTRNIRRSGFAYMAVDYGACACCGRIGPAQEDAHPFSYTIGIYEQCHAHEVLLMVPTIHAAGQFVHAYYQRVRDDGPCRLGVPFVLSLRVPMDDAGAVEDVDVLVQLCRLRPRGAAQLTMARSYYHGRPFDAAALIVPDAESRWPWHPDCDPDVQRMQDRTWYYAPAHEVST